MIVRSEAQDALLGSMVAGSPARLTVIICGTVGATVVVLVGGLVVVVEVVVVVVVVVEVAAVVVVVVTGAVVVVVLVPQAERTSSITIRQATPK
jgi:hypothetical protein